MFGHQTLAPKMRTVIQHTGQEVWILSEVRGLIGWSMVDRVRIPEGKEEFRCTGIKMLSWNSQLFQADMREIAR
jgi:hypothetical protein